MQNVKESKIDKLVPDNLNANKGTEYWLPIPGYIAYEASSHGRIRSVDHYDSMNRFKCGIIKKFKNHRNGYLLVCLNHSDIHLVHRLIVKTFIGEIKNGLEVNHKDGDKKNNRVENLELCTKSYNQIHRCKILGHMPKSQLEPMAKYAKNRSTKVRALVSEELLNSNNSSTKISSITGVSKSTINRMRNGK